MFICTSIQSKNIKKNYEYTLTYLDLTLHTFKNRISEYILSRTHPGSVSINKNLSRTHPESVSINKKLSKTHPGSVSINKNLSRTHPGSVSINKNLSRTHPGSVSIIYKLEFEQSPSSQDQ